MSRSRSFLDCSNLLETIYPGGRKGRMSASFPMAIGQSAFRKKHHRMIWKISAPHHVHRTLWKGVDVNKVHTCSFPLDNHTVMTANNLCNEPESAHTSTEAGPCNNLSTQSSPHIDQKLPNPKCFKRRIGQQRSEMDQAASSSRETRAALQARRSRDNQITLLEPAVWQDSSLDPAIWNEIFEMLS